MEIHWIKAQAPRRVLALAKHLGVEARFIEQKLGTEGLKSPAYAALNPNMKAPVLVDGDVVLWESAAIMAYLCIKQGSDLWPAHDPRGQVDVLRWISWNNSHWSPEVSPYYFEHIVKATFGIGPPDRDALRDQAKLLPKYARVLDDHLQDRPYVALDRLTIADFQIASMASYWREAEMPLHEYPNVVRWLDRLMHIPAWADPWPDKPQSRA